MSIYLILLIVTVGLLYLSRNNKKWNDTILWVDCGVLILLLALRANTCADDTLFYYDYFAAPNGIYKFEFFYDLLNKVVYLISGNFQVLLLCNASLAIIPIFYLISKHKDRHVYVFLYQALTLYAFNFAIMRQTIAMSFVLLACVSLREGHEKKLDVSSTPDRNGKQLRISSRTMGTIKGAIFLLIAVLFHNTAVIFAPLLLIDRIKFMPKLICVISVATVLMFFFREPILKTVFGIFFPDKVNVYLNTFELDFGVVPVALFCISIMCYFLLQRVYHVKQSEQTNILVKTMGYSLYIATCLCWIPATGRLNQYGYLFMMFLVGNIYESITEEVPHAKKVKCMVYIFGIILYVWQLSQNVYHIIPYYTFFS